MKNILLISLLFGTFSAAAQLDSLNAVIAQETCDCILKTDIANETKQSIEMSLGLCMLEAIQNNNVDIDISDSDAMSKFGEKIGVKMAFICPLVFEKFIAEEYEEDSNSGFLSIEGEIDSIEENELQFIIIKEANGKKTKLIWLRYFDGSNEYIKKPKKLIGKKVNITYQLIDCYLPQKKEYYSFKEIVGMEFQ